jgi:hypothetical protein
MQIFTKQYQVPDMTKNIHFPLSQQSTHENTFYMIARPPFCNHGVIKWNLLMNTFCWKSRSPFLEITRVFV